MIEVFEELDECGVPTYGARIETAAETVAVSGFDTEEDALVAVLEGMRMVAPRIEYRGKSFFISGPMTDVEFNNAPEFARVHAFLKEQGAGRIFDPAHAWLGEQGQEKSHEHYVRACLFRLLNERWDHVVMLDGWERSGGATLEHDVAVACGMSVVDVVELGCGPLF